MYSCSLSGDDMLAIYAATQAPGCLFQRSPLAEERRTGRTTAAYVSRYQCHVTDPMLVVGKRKQTKRPGCLPVYGSRAPPSTWHTGLVDRSAAASSRRRDNTAPAQKRHTAVVELVGGAIGIPALRENEDVVAMGPEGVLRALLVGQSRNDALVAPSSHG